MFAELENTNITTKHPELGPCFCTVRTVHLIKVLWSHIEPYNELCKMKEGTQNEDPLDSPGLYEVIRQCLGA